MLPTSQTSSIRLGDLSLVMKPKELEGLEWGEGWEELSQGSGSKELNRELE